MITATRWLSIALSGSLLVAGCGSDDGDDATTAVGTSPVSAVASSAPDVTESAPIATTMATAEPTTVASTEDVITSDAPVSADGEPIKLSTLYPANGPTAAPDVLDGATAAASAINSAGGVDVVDGPNRPIEIVECDSDNTANPSAPSECARDVIDAGVVLDVGKYTLAGDEVDVFSAAGVAMLGNSPFSENDLTDPLSFPLAGAGASLVPGTAAALQNAGLETMVYLSLDIPAAHAAAAFIGPILDDPAQLVDTVLLPLDPSADLAPFWARVVDAAPAGVILGVPPGLLAAAVGGLRQAGYEGAFVATPYTLTSAALESLGDDAEGMLCASNFTSISDLDNPVIQQFNAEMDEFAPGAEKSEFSLNSWLAVHLAADIATELDVVDAASFAAALRGREVDLGVAPPFVLGESDIYLQFPRVFRATVHYQVVEDGTIVPADGDEFIDLNALVEG